MPAATLSGLAQRFVEEGLRMADHPGVVFKDGPSGRRAALPRGPDVWEVVKVLREIDQTDESSVAAVADMLVLTRNEVRVVLDHYAGHSEEIDQEIVEADTASVAAEAAWRQGVNDPPLSLPE